MLFEKKFHSIIYIPTNAKLTVLKNLNDVYTTLYITIGDKKFIFVSRSKIVINKWANSITFIKREKSADQVKINNEFESFFYSLNFYFFKKIKFKGKGFRIKFFKKIKLIKFYFGRSHKTFMLIKKLKRKKINKYKFILFSINKQKVNKISVMIKNIKKFNFYTLRGIRSSRQIIYKRKGKKGTYI